MIYRRRVSTEQIFEEVLAENNLDGHPFPEDLLATPHVIGRTTRPLEYAQASGNPPYMVVRAA